jgi:hypothetical protein
MLRFIRPFHLLPPRRTMAAPLLSPRHVGRAIYPHSTSPFVRRLQEAVLQRHDLLLPPFPSHYRIRDAMVNMGKYMDSTSTKITAPKKTIATGSKSAVAVMIEPST